jgi:saccharopine dehydrogenase-like NADP-dependent oxidoreductase
MKAMVLGMGLQGKAVIHDLESNGLIKEIFAADIFPTEQSRSEAEAYIQKKGYSKTKTIKLDVFKEMDLPMAFSSRDINVVICMLPIGLALTAARAALDAGIPFVSSNYTYDLIQLDDLAREKKGIILPEMGLDPGIDLILGRLATDQLDTVHGFYSYGGGVPAPEIAHDSPIKYKISWIFDGVLAAYVREARQIKNGKLLVVPGHEIFKKENVHEIEFAGIGVLEAYPNGDSERYVKIFGLSDELKEMGRFALRWTGHSNFWRTMVALGLLDDAPININQADIIPREFLSKCLAPRLQYKADERDIALLRVEAWGIKEGKKMKITYDLIDYRDMESGLFAMNRTVGFTSSIGALMILTGKITQTGVLSPVRHVPPHEFINELKARGFQINCKIEELE